MSARRRRKRVGDDPVAVGGDGSPLRTPCPSHDVLRRFLLGLVSRGELASLEGHVSVCPACAAALDQLSATDPLAEAVRAQPAATRRLDGYRADIEAAVARVKASVKRPAS